MADDAANGVGAYGLRLSGVDGVEQYLVDAPETWLPLRLVPQIGEAALESGFAAGGRAEFMTLSGARVGLDLERGQAMLTAPRPLGPEEIVHPCLASVGAMAAHLQGHETFHAAAVCAGGGAWAIVGDRESGKSSTLASLSVAGLGVLCDDMLVLHGKVALAGPRAIDLRSDAAQQLGVGENLGVVGTRERWRVRVGSVAPEVPLRGWLFLEWGDKVEAALVASSERLERLLPKRGVRLSPPDLAELLDLAQLPGYVVRRPRDPSRLQETASLIAETISDADSH